MRVDLSELLKRENERVEWKRDVADISDVVRTAVAFANDFSNLGGGFIVCGADEVKSAEGFQDVQLVGLTAARLKEVENHVLAHCREKVDPPIVPLTEELSGPDDSKRVLVFVVPSTGAAHSYRKDGKDASTYYIRIGRETREAKNGLLRELLVRRGQLDPWDRRGNENSTIEDIDLIALRDLLQQIGAWDLNRSLEDYLSPKEQLSVFVPPLTATRPLDATARPRNFTLLLFGRTPMKYIPGAYVVFSAYPGKDRSEPTAERIEITGGLVEQSRRIIARLNTEAYTAFDKNSPNPNQVKYPVRALQEAVVNALVHRDYESDQPVRVTVFSDRIEIISPGALPRTIDPESFKHGNAAPMWRNQALAYFFSRLQLAQAEGQGIPTILRLMKDEGCPPPQFVLEAERVSCILPAHPRHALMRELNAIEKKVILGNYGEALASLDSLLDIDPYNFRALELYCEVNNALKTPRRVAELLLRKNMEFDLINPSTLLVLAETLTQVSEDPDMKDVADRLNAKALSGQLEEDDLRRAVINLRKMKQDDKAIDVLENVFARNPIHAKNAVLRDVAARARMDLAKRCMETGRDRSKRPETRKQAWDLAREYLAHAERDLRVALDNVASEIDRDYMERDVEFLRHMKNVAAKPSPRESLPTQHASRRGKGSDQRENKRRRR